MSNMDKLEDKIVHVHSGQYRRYGDYYRVWDINDPDASPDEILAHFFKDGQPLPNAAEFSAKTWKGGSDPAYYFRGYYKLVKTEYGYRFTICEPYCD